MMLEGDADWQLEMILEMTKFDAEERKAIEEKKADGEKKASSGIQIAKLVKYPRQLDGILCRIKDVFVFATTVSRMVTNMRLDKTFLYEPRGEHEDPPLALARKYAQNPHSNAQGITVEIEDHTSVGLDENMASPVRDGCTGKFKVGIAGKRFYFECSLSPLVDVIVFQDGSVATTARFTHCRREYTKVSVSPMGTVDVEYDDYGFTKALRYFLLW